MRRGVYFYSQSNSFLDNATEIVVCVWCSLNANPWPGSEKKGGTSTKVQSTVSGSLSDDLITSDKKR